MRSPASITNMHQCRSCCKRLAAAHRFWHSTTRAAATTASTTRAAATADAPSAAQSKRRVVFLGTPEVAAIALRELIAASKAESSTFEVAAVVSQPGKPKGRGNKAVPVPSPVEQLAREHLPDEAILCPKSAKEAAFLEAFAALQPDLAITAAYGNMLPTAFLSIPKHGTLNIHPSLLPKYRGAAPVQRAVQDGVSTTGVSVAFTVLQCDAGPIFLQEQVAVPEDEQAPQLLERLFKQGAQLLISNIDRVWTGEAAQVAWQQDHSQATHAAKITKEESQLDFSNPAAVLHNQVRAFAGWPGAFATFTVSRSAGSEGSSSLEQLQVKVLESRHVPAQVAAGLLQQAAPGQVVFLEQGKRMLVPCGDGAALEVLQLQPPTKKAMQPKAFYNGLSGKQLSVQQQPVLV